MSFKVSGAGLSSLAAGLLASVCVLFQWWLPLAAVLFGLPAALLLISEPFKALIMWLLLSPALGSYIKLSLPVGIPDITFDRLVIGCIVLALALQVMFRRGRLLPAGQTEKAMALFVVLGLLDVFFRSPTKGSEFLIFFDEYGVPFLLFVAAKNLFHSHEQIQTVPPRLVPGWGISRSLWNLPVFDPREHLSWLMTLTRKRWAILSRGEPWVHTQML